jgi:hypothetical protein
MDVPTLVFNPGEFFYGGKLVKKISACPYLTKSVGRTWKSINELQTLIQRINSGNIRFKPREFAINISVMNIVLDTYSEVWRNCIKKLTYVFRGKNSIYYARRSRIRDRAGRHSASPIGCLFGKKV